MKLLTILIGLEILICLSGCASIVSKSTYPVRIKSTPVSSSFFTVRNESGEAVHSGRTPQTVMLKSGNGFFDGATYRVEFEEGNIVKIDSSLDPWYFGNILFGGLLGMVIVDPLTGAMWELPESATAYVYSDKKFSNPGSNNKSASKAKR